MRPDLLNVIRTTSYLDEYLKYHSYWYQYLIDDPSSISKMDEYAKKEYKLTLEDKINNMTDKLSIIQTFLDVMK